jgi:hypothetical protein
MLGDAPAVCLLRAKSLDVQAAAALYRDLIESEPDLRAEAEFQLAQISTFEEKERLMLEAATKGHLGAKRYLLGRTRNCPGKWPIGVAEYFEGAKKFLSGDRFESSRLWRVVPIEFAAYYKNLPNWAVLGFIWSKCTDLGNSFEAGCAKVTFAKVLMVKQLEQVPDWMMILVLLEQAFALPNVCELLAAEVPTIVAYLEKTSPSWPTYVGVPNYSNFDQVHTFLTERHALADRLRKKFPEKFDSDDMDETG